MAVVISSICNLISREGPATHRCADLSQAWTPSRSNTQGPNYEDAQRAKRDRQSRLNHFAEEMRRLSGRYLELAAGSASGGRADAQAGDDAAVIWNVFTKSHHKDSGFRTPGTADTKKTKKISG